MNGPGQLLDRTADGGGQQAPRIASGEPNPGSRLPITGLAQEYDLAITTVQKTMQAFKDDGEIVTSPMGTFVARP